MRKLYVILIVVVMFFSVNAYAEKQGEQLIPMNVSLLPDLVFSIDAVNLTFEFWDNSPGWINPTEGPMAVTFQFPASGKTSTLTARIDPAVGEGSAMQQWLDAGGAQMKCPAVAPWVSQYVALPHFVDTVLLSTTTPIDINGTDTIQLQLDAEKFVQYYEPLHDIYRPEGFEMVLVMNALVY